MNRRHQLHLIIDRRAILARPGRERAPGHAAGAEEEVLAVLAAALRGGVDALQVREKSAAAVEVWQLTLAAARLARRHGALVLVNDRVDVAVATAAHGVHLAARSLPPEVARSLLRPGQLVGCSVHSVEEAVAAARAGADYVTFGHVYDTSSKPGLPPRGVSELARVVEAVPIPVLAIGGINADNVARVLATGCAGIAVISAIQGEAEPEEAARRLRAALDATPYQPRHPWPARPRSEVAT